MTRMIKRLLLLLVLIVAPSFATTTQLTGTLIDSSGSPVSGTACFKLPVNAIDTSTNRALSPRPICFPLTNGTFPAFASLVPNDVIQPINTYYQAKVTDRTGALIFMANYVIPTGTGTFNIGTAIPTQILTSNISFAGGSISLSTPNVFTAPQTFLQINSSNSPISTSGFLRLGSGDAIKFRNAGNGSDLNGMTSDGTANLVLGGVATNSIQFKIGGSAGSMQYVSTNTLQGQLNLPFTIQAFSTSTSGQILNLFASPATGASSVGGAINITAGTGGFVGGGGGGDIVLTPGDGNLKGKVT